MAEKTETKDAAELTDTEPEEANDSNVSANQNTTESDLNSPQEQNEDSTLINLAQTESDPTPQTKDDIIDDCDAEQEIRSNHDENETEKESKDNDISTATKENEDEDESNNEAAKYKDEEETSDVAADIDPNDSIQPKMDQDNEDIINDETNDETNNETNNETNETDDETNNETNLSVKDTEDDNDSDNRTLNDTDDVVKDENEDDGDNNDTNNVEDKKDAKDNEVNESQDKSVFHVQDIDDNDVNAVRDNESDKENDTTDVVKDAIHDIPDTKDTDDVNEVNDENTNEETDGVNQNESDENNINEVNDGECEINDTLQQSNVDPNDDEAKPEPTEDEEDIPSNKTLVESPETQPELNDDDIESMKDNNDDTMNDIDQVNDEESVKSVHNAPEDEEVIPFVQQSDEIKPEPNTPPNDNNVVESEINAAADVEIADTAFPQTEQNQSFFDEEETYNDTTGYEKDDVMEQETEPMVNDESDNKQSVEPQKITTEIGVQTIIHATEIKLSSKTKKRIAEELGFVVDTTRASATSQHKELASMSPVVAAKQMRSSSQKIAKIMNQHKSELAVIFDRYSNGLTHKIKLDGLSRMLKDRNILKKLSLIPEITKAFHKSSFTKDTPESLTFDEFLQCIIRLANDLLSRKKKAKYKTAECRVSLFLAKLNLRPFPKPEDQSAGTIKNKAHVATKSIAQDLSQSSRNSGNTQSQYDYRLSEKQLDSEFDHYFNTGGFFSDAASSQTASVKAPDSAERHDQPQAHKMVPSNNDLGPLSPPFKRAQQAQNNIENQKRKRRNLNTNGAVPQKPVHKQNRNRMNKRVKPSPLQQKRVPKKKKRVSSYQEMYNSATPQTQTETQSDITNNIQTMQSPNTMDYAHPHNTQQAQYQMQTHHNNMVQTQYQQSPAQHNMYHQPQMQPQYHQAQMQPQSQMNPNIMYQHQLQQQTVLSPSNYETYEVPQHQQYSDCYEPQHGYNNTNNNAYNEDFERAERQLTNQLQHLTETEQQLVRNIHQRQQNQLNRAMPHRSNRR